MPTDKAVLRSDCPFSTVYVMWCPTCTALLGVAPTRVELRDESCHFCAPGKRGKVTKYAAAAQPARRKSEIAAGEVPPFHAFFMRDGWPVAIVTPSGGRQLGEGPGVENMIIDFLKEATIAAGGTPSDFHADYEEITP